jgi:pimeloyl-ACP methyl ester carboxylesterase
MTEKRGIAWLKEHRMLLIIVGFVVLVSVFFFGTRLILYVNFLLGNDIFVTVTAGEDVLQLERGMGTDVSFEVVANTNPFCKAECVSTFEDVSLGEVLNTSSFELLASSPLRQEFEIHAERKGEGIDLYRYSVSCTSVGSYLCQTKGFETQRSVLLTVERTLPEEERELRHELRGRLKIAVDRVRLLKGAYGAVNSVNSPIVDDAGALLPVVEQDLKDAQRLWDRQEYALLESVVSDIEERVDVTQDAVDEFDFAVRAFVSSFNYIVNDTRVLRDELIVLAGAPLVDPERAVLLNETIGEFNNLVSWFTRRSIENNGVLWNGTLSDVADFNVENIVIGDVVLASVDVSFAEPESQCCVFGECRSCCYGGACSDENYPVLFVHGHAFNDAVSAEYSLDAFNGLQNKLEEEGIVNAGAISLYTLLNVPEGIWGVSGSAVSVKVSYYLDIFEDQGDFITVQTKSENIDTYAVRLKELIDTVQFKTGKDKVRIVAHSMGGLVVRRYAQIFGDAALDRIVFIGVPHSGITKKIADICSVVGEALECRDMQQGSLFLNKLGRGGLPNVPVVNIVGTGCDMNGVRGDGIVLEESARLKGVSNVVIEGDCNNDLLHKSLLNIKKYPAVYGDVLDGLK